MRLLFLLFAIGYGFMCGNCLPPRPPRTEYVTSETQALAVKILSLPSSGLTRLEARLAAQDLARQAGNEQGLMRMVARGEVVEFLHKWKRDIQIRLSLDYGPLVFDEELVGLFSPAAHWILYTHHEDLPSLPVLIQHFLAEENKSDDEFCPVLSQFRFTFPRSYKISKE